MSYNSNHRPSDPPRVDGQQFGRGYGGSPASNGGYGAPGQSGSYPSGTNAYGSHQYGSGQAGSYPYGSGQDGVVRYGDGRFTDYGEYLDAVGSPGRQQYAASQSGAELAMPGVGMPGGGYSQQMVGYSQPMTYGAPGPMFVWRPKVNALSGWSMWMGIIGLAGGFVCAMLSLIPFIQYLAGLVSLFLWLAPILAVIFGHRAQAQIKRTGEGGRGQATAGLVMGYIAIGLWAISIAFVIMGVIGFALLAGLMR